MVSPTSRCNTELLKYGFLEESTKLPYFDECKVHCQPLAFWIIYMCSELLGHKQNIPTKIFHWFQERPDKGHILTRAFPNATEHGICFSNKTYEQYVLKQNMYSQLSCPLCAFHRDWWNSYSYVYICHTHRDICSTHVFAIFPH